MIAKIWNKSNIVTFIGILFSVLGIYFCFVKLTYIAVIMLMLAGICDAFDGTIARKINKGTDEYGIQLDSLADIISSGVLPACIGLALDYNSPASIIVYTVFVMCGVTRLAYYNVESSSEKSFVGIPITTSTIMVPIIYILLENEWVFTGLLAILAVLYVANIKIPKPSLVCRIILSVIAILSAIYLICSRIFFQ